MDLVNFFDPQRERFPGKMWRIALPHGGQPSALPTATAIDELPSGTVKDDVATEVDGLGDDQHFDWEDQPWKIQTSGHPVRLDTPEYVASRQKMNEMTRGATGLIYGEGPYHNHHGGSLWLKDDEGWFIVRNQAGIESSAMFCADPAKVALLRLNAKRLYDLLSPGIKEELDPGGLLLDTPIHDAAQVAKLADSVFNAGVPLPRGLHIGVLPADETQNSSNAADTHLAGTQLAGIHHYPTPIAEIQLFKYNDFHLWVTDQQGKPAAVAPLAERGSGDGRVQVLYATPGSHLAELKDAAERDGHPLILNPDHPLSKQAYKNQVP